MEHEKLLSGMIGSAAYMPDEYTQRVSVMVAVCVAALVHDLPMEQCLARHDDLLLLSLMEEHPGAPLPWLDYDAQLMAYLEGEESADACDIIRERVAAKPGMIGDLFLMWATVVPPNAQLWFGMAASLVQADLDRILELSSLRTLIAVGRHEVEQLARRHRRDLMEGVI